MAEHLVSLSLPKTGTTYLEGLLAADPRYCKPSIKEPSYFFACPKPRGVVMSRVLVPGNRAKGQDWYAGLYSPDESLTTRIDFSTQYWLHAAEVIQSVPDESRFIIIERRPFDQIVSYVAHLRRGYIRNEPLEKLFERDDEFARYLDDMVRAGTDSLSSLPVGVDVVRLSFDSLVQSPLTHITEKLGLELDGFPVNLSKNERSTARNHALNRLLFSTSLRRLGRQLPRSLYAPLVRGRKSLVNHNLKPGHGDMAHADLDFLSNRYQDS